MLARLKSDINPPFTHAAYSSFGMSLSVVNGQLCFCACDVAKAQHGKNPHTPPGQVDNNGPSTAKDNPPVTFGGLLKDLTNDAVSPSGSTTATQPKLDIRT